MFSYDTSIADNTIYKKEYNEYTYSEATDTYTAYAMQSPTNLERYYGNSWTTLWQASVSYENTFASSHNVSGLLLFEEAHSVGDNIRAARDFLYLYLIYLRVILPISLVQLMQMD